MRFGVQSQIRLSAVGSHGWDDATIVHLVNMSGWHPLAPVTAHVEHVPSLGPIAVRVRTGKAPQDVQLVPGGEGFAWSYANGWTTIHVPLIEIHAALVLTGASAD